MQNLNIFWTSDFSKNMFLDWFWNGFCRLRVAKGDQKSIKNQSQIDARKSEAKCSQNHQRIYQHGFQIGPKSSKNNPKTDSKIDAKSVIQKSIKNRAVERQKVAKVTSIIQPREVSGPEGSLYSKKEEIPTRRWAEGPPNFVGSECYGAI